ncbi:MAG TPA: phosphoribosylformylglycinamidine synthase subunit PurL [Pirellulaceae bacterium]|nr:phosphoribosylformylglycinamidine synthase subunit PurL [Pirellulaceae bacterium]
MTLWEVDLHPRPGFVDRRALDALAQARDVGVGGTISVRSAHGYLLEGELTSEQVESAARRLLCDPVVEQPVIGRSGDETLVALPAERHDAETTNGATLVQILPKPGVTDAVAETALRSLQDLGLPIEEVRTVRKYWLFGLGEADARRFATKALANESIEQIVTGPLALESLHVGSHYPFNKVVVRMLGANPERLDRISRDGQLSLTREEMLTIQAHYRDAGRDPTDVELETIAQTWSEHCSHKTLKGRIRYRDERGERLFDNMLRETIFEATQQVRRDLGDKDWCVSVFKDNAGVVTFAEEAHVTIKVETHNRPSAIEPYGGANTGLGGVIRDTLGTGLGAKPIASTDVFCFAPPDMAPEDVPPGALHPRRIMNGVVAGVRDYGNRMGIPTVNGALFFDRRYVGNPLVFCGSVGLLPKDKAFKSVEAGDLIVAIGGRTGRDGIHGATFSSVELTSESETVSSGAVQIGHAVTEKMAMDVLLAARDRGLFRAVTDCGAGGFSSAVGEMGEELGAEVHLDRAPLKYAGLSYAEIWISEAQERMVFAVPPEKWEEMRGLCESEGVEATVLGTFEATGRLRLFYNGAEVGDLSMKFLHDGRPPIVREATYSPPAPSTPTLKHPLSKSERFDADLLAILASPNVASKESIIRQYDHEVLAGSVIKPLVGAHNDGPSDAAVIRPILSSRRGLVVACGMNPRLGDFDAYWMAASGIDEAVRNCVAVGADPNKIALLDNFCWGRIDRPETLGSLVRAALACQDLSVAWKTPFISGKDSLNNEFRYDGSDGPTTLVIPPTLLITALGQVENVARCVTMDLKKPGNAIYLVGRTWPETAGSHFHLVRGIDGGLVPQVRTAEALATFQAVHRAIDAGLVRSCHDLSEGGLAVALAESAFAGGFGVEADLDEAIARGLAPGEYDADQKSASEALGPVATILFAESNSRFLMEVAPDKESAFRDALGDVACFRIGAVTDGSQVTVRANGETCVDASLAELKEAWQKPLRF